MVLEPGVQRCILPTHASCISSWLSFLFDKRSQRFSLMAAAVLDWWHVQIESLHPCDRTTLRSAHLNLDQASKDVLETFSAKGFLSNRGAITVILPAFGSCHVIPNCLDLLILKHSMELKCFKEKKHQKTITQNIYWCLLACWEVNRTGLAHPERRIIKAAEDWLRWRERPFHYDDWLCVRLLRLEPTSL